jgi:MFS family permease
MIVTQAVMVAIMTMTPIHMRDHGHALGAAGLVISIHVAAMYLPAPLSGLLTDRAGRHATLGLGAITLLAAGVLAAVAPTHSMVVLAIALGLLGFGWSLGLVAGTAMVTDATPLQERAGTQGKVDLCVALAGAAGGMSSGFVVESTSFATLSLAGGALALLLLPLIFATRVARPEVARLRTGAPPR